MNTPKIDPLKGATNVHPTPQQIAHLGYSVDEFIANMQPLFSSSNWRIMIHPNHRHAVIAKFLSDGPRGDWTSGDQIIEMNGIRIEFTRLVPKHPRVWKFPPDRFIKYGPEDLAWAIPLGFGHWEEDESCIAVTMVNEDEGRRVEFTRLDDFFAAQKPNDHKFDSLLAKRLLSDLFDDHLASFTTQRPFYFGVS